MPLDPKMLIKKLKKRHKPSEQFSGEGLTRLVICTEGKTSKGSGILEHIWEIEAPDGLWISEDRVCVFVKPDSILESTKLDRYANEIPEDRKPQIVKLNKPKVNGK